MDGMKLSLEGQFTWSVQFFLFLTFYSQLCFSFEPPFLFYFFPLLLTQVLFWDLLPTYLPTTLPGTDPSTSFMLLTPPPPLVLHSPPSPTTLTFGFRIYL
jgi:hypothetical protein